MNAVNPGGCVMLTQQQIIDRAHERMFENIGVTGAEPFESQQRIWPHMFYMPPDQI